MRLDKAPPVPLVIVGAGVMGANHARVAHQCPRASVSWVVDNNAERARAVAQSVGARWAPSLEAVDLSEVRGAVVAVPTQHHRAPALALLGAGVPLLLEKPFTGTLQDADAVLLAAAKANVMLMIGHTERFNPVVRYLERSVRDLVHIDAVRISPFSQRVTSNVVLDMMIHDLDILLALAGAPVTCISGIGQQRRGASVDLASILLTFANGITATVTASRLGQAKIREVLITQHESFVRANLLRQDLQISKVEQAEYLSDAGTRYRQSEVVEIPFLEERGEPLYLEMEHFVTCIIDGNEPLITGVAGRRALELALRAEASLALATETTDG